MKHSIQKVTATLSAAGFTAAITTGPQQRPGYIARRIGNIIAVDACQVVKQLDAISAALTAAQIDHTINREVSVIVVR